MQDPKTLKRWMAFQLTSRPNGTVDKQPLSVFGGFAASDDPATWASYEAAREYCLEHKDCQLGFVLGEEVGLVVIDIDKARVSKEQEWPTWVQREVEELDSFVEESVSGLGLHVWVWGSIPANMNRQKLHVELHGSKKMFVVSNEFAQQWEKIQPRDLTKLVARVEAGEIGPNYKPPIKAYAYSSEKFQRACDGNTVDYDYDNSRAVQGVLWTLARKHQYDEEKIREEFEATKLCAIWEEKGSKWTRLGADEIARAIEEVKKRDSSKSKAMLDETLVGEPVKFNPWEYAMKPLPGLKYSGWFPRGRITLVSGSSGAMKTTFLTQTLVYGRDGESFLGHEAGRLPFFMVFADRGKWDVEETFDRMNLQGKIPYECVNGMGTPAALSAIADVAKKHAVVVIDGGDLLVVDNNDGTSVGEFTTALQRIAQHYGSAFIITTGSGKMMAKAIKEGAERRSITKGSEVWGRTGGTVFTLNSEGDGTEPTRRLVVQHRNAPVERFLLTLVNGRLKAVVEAAEHVDEFSLWARGEEWFSLATVLGQRQLKSWNMTKKEVQDRIKELKKAGKLIVKEGVSPYQYRWQFGSKGEKSEGN